MKLRNKKTGEIKEYGSVGATTFADGGVLEAFAVYDSLAALNDEWEDYEEPKEYWYMENNGDIDKETYDGDDYEKRMIEIGNCFETEEEAKEALEKLKAWKRLKDKDFQFHGHNALGIGEIKFSLDFEDMDDEGEIGQLRHDLDLLFGGEE